MRDTWLRPGWELLIAAISLSTAMFLPLDLLRHQATGAALSPWWSLFSLIGLLDVGGNFFLNHEQDGQVVRGVRQIASHYLRGGFSVDLAANLPGLSLGPAIAGSTLALLPLLRLVRLIQLSNRWEVLHVLDARWIRILRYSIALALVTHWMACLWLWVGLNDPSPEGWIRRSGMAQQPFSRLYEQALHWALTLVAAGYGELIPKTPLEIRAAMPMLLASLLIYSFAIANMLTVLNQLDGGRSEFRSRQSKLASFLRFNGVSRGTIDRVRRFNDYQWSRNRGMEAGELFSALPGELRSEVSLEMMRESVERLPLLAFAGQALRKKLLSRLDIVTFPPGTVVLEADERGNEILFLVRGWVEIEPGEMLPDEVRTVREGDYVGDLSFFLHEPRSCRVRTGSYVVAFVLKRPVFEQLREEEPNLRKLLQAIASQQSERNQVLLLAGVVA